MLAALASVSVPTVFALSSPTHDDDQGGSRGFPIFVSTIAAGGALSGPIFLSEVGTTFNDYGGAIVILAALWLVLRRNFGPRAHVIAGALLGVAVGVKLTNATYVLGWAAAIVMVETLKAVRPLLASGVGCVAAFLPIGGLWNAYIYSLFKNPIFALYHRGARRRRDRPGIPVERLSLLDEDAQPSAKSAARTRYGARKALFRLDFSRFGPPGPPFGAQNRASEAGPGARFLKAIKRFQSVRPRF